jgi:GDP-mannose 6-dehydrogenase
VCDEIGSVLADDDGRRRTVVIRSTILPGTIHDVVVPTLEQASGRRAGTAFGVATNPEFLREGSSIRDFFEASRTIVGADDEASADPLRELYRGLPAPILVVPIRTAELAKYADNAFHAVKIAFANEMASFARRFDIDGRDVMRLLTSDDRLNISTAYLRPGYAFGGSCLPKDLRAITDRARKSDVSVPLLDAALASNRAHFERGVQLVEEVGGRAVALLGLSFKPSTDDLRESPAVALAERLLGRGYAVTIYDEDVQPDQIRGANRAFIDEHLPHVGRLLAASLEESVRAADTVVVTKASSAAGVPRLLTDHQTVVDLVGVPWAAELPPERYRGIGW